MHTEITKTKEVIEEGERNRYTVPLQSRNIGKDNKNIDKEQNGREEH